MKQTFNIPECCKKVTKSECESAIEKIKNVLK